MTQPYRPDPSNAARQGHRTAAQQAAAAHSAATGRAHSAHAAAGAQRARGRTSHRDSRGAGRLFRVLLGAVALVFLGFVGITALAGADVGWAVQVSSWFESLTSG